MRLKLVILGSLILAATALRGEPTAGFSPSKIHPVPDAYWVFAPAKVGEFGPNEAFAFDANVSDSKTKAAKEAVRFIYDIAPPNNNKDRLIRRHLYVDVIKYASESAAQAEVKKRVDAAVPTEQYDKKVKLPKCDPKHETNFNAPEEFVKKLPLKKGGDAYVLHMGKFWDYQCKKVSNNDEYVTWASGVYVFRLDCSGASGENYPSIFGQGEAAFADYQKAIGE
jgi:hypothetical protein